MAIEVRIPTILRQYTGGAKSVHASGGSLGSLSTGYAANQSEDVGAVC